MAGDYPQRGEVWRVPFPMPSKDHAQFKRRPVVVVSATSPRDTGGTVTTIAVSSSVSRLTDFDIPVPAKTNLARAMGLDRDSVICCAILYTYSLAAFKTRLGRVNDKTQQRIDDMMRKALFPGPE